LWTAFYDEVTYQLLLLERKAAKAAKITAAASEEIPMHPEGESQVTGGFAAADAEEDVKKLKVSIRASSTDTHVMAVKATVSCGKILRHYFKVKSTVSPPSNARLQFDGENLDMDMPIGEAEYDKEDDSILLDVVGL
jgi:hypothetical protein